MKRIVIFASGEGTNTQRLIDYFRGKQVKVVMIVCNNPKANVLNRAKANNIPVFLVTKEEFQTGETLLKKLKEEKTDMIVCAGFLWKIPDSIVCAFPGRIVNIHPSLLPKFGGKGMYGMNVHKAVIDAGEKESGITIHYLNEEYDKGEIILQKKCKVEENETPDSLAEKVHQLEYEWYPKTIEQLLNHKL